MLAPFAEHSGPTGCLSAVKIAFTVTIERIQASARKSGKFSFSDEIISSSAILNFGLFELE